jgi:hypothetical protein
MRVMKWNYWARPAADQRCVGAADMTARATGTVRLSWYKIPPQALATAILGRSTTPMAPNSYAAYVYVDMGNSILYLMLTGNLESNFNKLENLFRHGGGGRFIATAAFHVLAG